MKFLKNVVSQLHVYVLWALISVIFWAWIFTMVNDAPQEKKLVIFIYGPVQEKDLSVELEKEMPEGIRMIRAHSFDYVVFGNGELETADLYLVPENEADGQSKMFCPLTPEVAASLLGASAAEEGALWKKDGVIYGVRAKAAGGSGPFPEQIGYDPAQTYYLFFSSLSVHAGDLTQAPDSTAFELARRFLPAR
ncbi:MAG: hypothetical protein IJL66_06980 [Lachnospiraceae bacterium]|nr:hypothetical protein [Lachnospiraceae bacterium]